MAAMAEDNNHHSDLGRSSRRPLPDLAAVTGHPSLASLCGRGWMLDGLLVTGVRSALVGALATSFVAYGASGAAIVVVWVCLTLPLAGLAVVTGDRRRARITLQVARYG
jgi:hypothetical protein